MGAKFYNESLWCWDKNQWESRGPGAFTMSWYIWPLLQRSIIRTSDVALTKFNNERRSRESRNSCASLFGNHILIYLLPSPMTRLYYNKLFSFEWTSRASNCTTHNSQLLNIYKFSVGVQNALRSDKPQCETSFF